MHIRQRVRAGVAGALITIGGMGIALTTAAAAPIALACVPGQITWLSGMGPPRTPLLIS